MVGTSAGVSKAGLPTLPPSPPPPHPHPKQHSVPQHPTIPINPPAAFHWLFQSLPVRSRRPGCLPGVASRGSGEWTPPLHPGSPLLAPATVQVNSWSSLEQQPVSTAGHHWSNSPCQQLVTNGATVCVNSWSPLEQQSMSTTGHHWSNSLCQQLVTTGATVHVNNWSPLEQQSMSTTGHHWSNSLCQQLVTTGATVNQLSWEQTSRSVVICATVGQLSLVQQ